MRFPGSVSPVNVPVLAGRTAARAGEVVALSVASAVSEAPTGEELDGLNAAVTAAEPVSLAPTVPAVTRVGLALPETTPVTPAAERELLAVVGAVTSVAVAASVAPATVPVALVGLTFADTAPDTSPVMSVPRAVEVVGAPVAIPTSPAAAGVPDALVVNGTAVRVVLSTEGRLTALDAVGDPPIVDTPTSLAV